ncbi:MAG: hypothetical protein ABII18_09590 [bacterium]|nr:hypothetical protein [bacterium]MBU1917077.1 hypothetical protein [bacterium]
MLAGSVRAPMMLSPMFFDAGGFNTTRAAVQGHQHDRADVQGHTTNRSGSLIAAVLKSASRFSWKAGLVAALAYKVSEALPAKAYDPYGMSLANVDPESFNTPGGLIGGLVILGVAVGAVAYAGLKN